MAAFESKSSPLLKNSLPRCVRTGPVLVLLIFALLASSANGTDETGRRVDQVEGNAFCLDRFEEASAVLIGGNEKLIIPTDQLPALAREGDILLVKMDQAGNFVDAEIDWEATRLRRERVQALLRHLLRSEEYQKPAAENQNQQQD